MIPSRAPAQLRYKLVLAFLAPFSIVLFTSCQLIVGDKLEDTPVPASSPTSSISLTPTVRATFTHLPGDIYFLYQTQTAAAPTYPPIRWRTNTPITPTPLYTLTAAALASTKSSCLLAYPDFCVSPLQRVGCPNLPFHNFTVLTPDPYGYDPDHDGIGCER